MNLREIEDLALWYMHEHGLLAEGWRLDWDRRSRNRAGQCNHRYKTIILGRHVWTIESNATEANVRNTVLHEIAHALVGPGHGHDAVWRRKAKSIGCTGQRCHEMEVKWKYHGGCKCGPKTFGRQRLAKGMHGASCPTCREVVKWKRVS